jgi:hypothetical protein
MHAGVQNAPAAAAVAALEDTPDIFDGSVSCLDAELTCGCNSRRPQ